MKTWRSFLKTEIQHDRFIIKIYIFLDKLTHDNIPMRWGPHEHRAVGRRAPRHSLSGSPIASHGKPAKKTTGAPCDFPYEPRRNRAWYGPRGRDGTEHARSPGSFLPGMNPRGAVDEPRGPSAVAAGLHPCPLAVNSPGQSDQPPWV